MPQNHLQSSKAPILDPAAPDALELRIVLPLGLPGALDYFLGKGRNGFIVGSGT